MKTIKLLFVLCFCILCCGNISRVSAQQPKALANAYNDISNHLHRNKVSYNHQLMRAYIHYCTAFDKLIDITKDENLKTIIYETKPEELKDQEEAYQSAKDKLTKYLKSFKEYAEVEKAQKEAQTEVQKKAANAAVSIVYNRLWNEDKKLKKLRSQELAALKAYRLAALNYIFKKFTDADQIMPTYIIDYQTKRYLDESNPDLHNKSLEITAMEALQKEIFRKHLRTNYNIPDTSVKSDDKQQTESIIP